MNFDQIKKEMTLDEGREKKIYKCSANKWSGGIGRNLQDKGFHETEIDLMFYNDFSEVVQDLHCIFQNFEKWPDELQHIVFNMRFQLGYSGFRKFKNFIKAAKALDLKQMAVEMQDSKWFKKDTPERAKRLVDRINVLRTG